MQIKSSLIILLCALATSASAQFNMLFNSDHDLPNSLVNCIAEDSNGIVWVATEDGLCKYNGSSFKTYRSVPSDPKSLYNNFVRIVVPDNYGNVIIGSIGGTQIYRSKHNDFIPAIPSEQGAIRNGNVNHILPLRSGGYLVGGNYAYTLYINKEGKPSIKPNIFTNQLKNIFRMAESKDGSLWAMVQGKGLYRTFPHHNNPNDKIALVTDENGKNYEFSAFCNAPDGNLYAGDIEKGLYILDEKTGRFKLIPITESFSRIRNIKAIPGTTCLCIASDGNGIRFYNYKTKNFDNSQQFDDPLIDISSQKVHSLFVNKTGDIWAALYQKGIMLGTHSAIPFKYIGPRSRRYNLIGDRCVTSILQDHEKTIWVATDNGGLYGIVNMDTPGKSESAPINMQQKAFFKASSDHGNQTSIPSAIIGLFEDSRHRLWFGSYKRGCGIVNKTTGICNYIPHRDQSVFSVYDYAEDKRGTIWAGSMGEGILRYNEKDNCMETFTSEGGTEWTGCIFYDGNHDKIYAGTYDGVIVVNPKDKNTRPHPITANCVVFSISRISSNTLAFSTNIGLILYDTEKQTSKTITMEHGLPSNSVYACQPGMKGHVWISSVYGLTHLSLDNMNVENFTLRDGLQGNEFYKNASMRTKSGSLWFGGINGVTFFRPSQLEHYSQKCDVRVVGIHSGDTEINPEEDGNYYVGVDENRFSVELATRPIYMSKRVIYSYHMDDGDWTTLPVQQNSVSFSDLSWGSHTLYVKTTTNGHDSQVSKTHIYIAYPWYLKWWMVIIWLVLTVAIGYLGIKEWHRRLKLRNIALEHMREEEEQEARLQFFMNLVHDLRTPITLISAPLKKLISTDADTSHKRLYNIMARNVDRILRLTNQIMDLRKIDHGKMELHCSETLVSEYISDMARSMEDIINSRHISLTLSDKTDGHQRIWLDTDFMETIILNLLSNAAKYTMENGTINVGWSIEDGMLSLTFTDTGIGIPDEDKPKIFNRFYQAYSPKGHVKGTGIGLNLVQSLIELHHGTITVSDNPDERGTRFTILLPAYKEAYKDSELYSANKVRRTEEEEPETPEEKLLVESFESDMEPIPTQTANNTQTPHAKVHKTILIVDDDDEIRSFLTEEFAVLYNILSAADGKTALDTLMKSKVDLVISDIMMPEIDGIELCRHIRQNVRLAHLPVILLTAKMSDQDRIEGLSVNADAYVTKPFNLDLLMTTVSNLLLRHDSLRNTFKGNTIPEERIETPKVYSADDKLMERLIKCINENLSNPNLTSDMLASEVGLSRVHLYRKLKELTNQSATNFIRNIRLTKSAELLKNNKATVSEVAYLVGFRTPSHFSTAFKELYGVTPTEYAKEEKDSM